jgi:YjjG family noncanonical pyrimidine nucleotidase
MKNYEWILFDAEGTLFDFDLFRILHHMFAERHVNFTPQDFSQYQNLNKQLWTKYQTHKMTAHQLLHNRFQSWADKLKTKTEVLNSAYFQTMANLCVPNEHVVELLEKLHPNTKLGIITNGFTELQDLRLEKTGLKEFFEVVIVSQEVGIAKPHAKIFEYAIEKMGNPAPGNVLLVGDNIRSDIGGGNNAGFDTCWYNVDKSTAPQNIKPTYEVASFAALDALIVKQPD